VCIARECGHSRVPVFSGTKDSIIGILYVKDLLRHWERRSDDLVSLKEIVRRAHFVPETKKVSELLQEFRSQRFHIAIVQDEFGGTAGLVTIEDIIEEILGEIEDEYEADAEPRRFVRVSEDEFEVDARYPVVAFNTELRHQLPVPVPEGDGFETLGGFLFNSLERVPVVGETYRHGPLRFEVVDADERMARRLRVHIERQAPADGGDGGAGGVGSPPGEAAKEVG
jgi:magnesium and cobalt transporter